MMRVDINYWGVLLAAVSAMVIGFLYYMPNVLGSTWMKLAKVDAKRFEKERGKVMPYVFVAALVTAYIMAVFVFVMHFFLGGSWLAAAFQTSLWVWLGFSATSLYVHNVLDQRPFQLTLISVGN